MTTALLLVLGADQVGYFLGGALIALGAVSLFVAGVTYGRQHPTRRPNLGTGVYPAIPTPVPAQQVVKDHHTDRFAVTELPTRRAEVEVDPFDPLEPVPTCLLCKQPIRRSL